MLRAGAQQLIHQAVEAELQILLDQHAGSRTSAGTAGVVRNGYLPARDLQTSRRPIPVRIPKVRSKTGEPVTFHSALVPPYIRKTRTLEAALPWLYLKGISSGEMGSALEVLVGPQAKGLSASTVSRLKQTWAQDYRNWNGRRLDRDQWVYIWADGVYSGLRAEQTKLCALVIIGVNEREELMAFYNFPAKHWQSIRTSNPFESTFGTIRHRTKRSKGCLSRDGMLHMMVQTGDVCTGKLASPTRLQTFVTSDYWGQIQRWNRGENS